MLQIIYSFINTIQIDENVKYHAILKYSPQYFLWLDIYIYGIM